VAGVEALAERVFDALSAVGGRGGRHGVRS
jgi:hypothetical protein